jgi:hypothetical protein
MINRRLQSLTRRFFILAEKSSEVRHKRIGGFLLGQAAVGRDSFKA